MAEQTNTVTMEDNLDLSGDEYYLNSLIDPTDNINYYITCSCNNLDTCDICRYNNDVSNYSYEEHYKYIDALHDAENAMEPILLDQYDADTLELMKESEARDRAEEERWINEYNDHGYGSNYDGGYDSH
jgi:hypothetical protein